MISKKQLKLEHEAALALVDLVEVIKHRPDRKIHFAYYAGRLSIINAEMEAMRGYSHADWITFVTNFLAAEDVTFQEFQDKWVQVVVDNCF